MKKFAYPPGIRYFLLFAIAASLFLTAFQTPEIAGISIWVWLLIILVVLVVLWYFLRPRPVPPPPPPVRTESRPAAVEVTTAPDDLTIIEGIGPKIADVLRSEGITTFEQLASTDEGRLRSILELNNLRLADPETWPEQARLAAEGDQESLMALQDRLKGGRNASDVG